MSWYRFLISTLFDYFYIQCCVRISDTGKSSWPELVGATGEAAEATIERENPRVDAIVISNGSFTDAQVRCDRVFVRVNSRGIVVQVPRIG